MTVKYSKGRTFFLICAFILTASSVSSSVYEYYGLPPLPHPSQYGNVLMDQHGDERTMPPVSFSHWSHRMQYTCRVCHFELEFAMEANGTKITEHDNLQGQYCGACHNGEIAFAHTKEYCVYCHNYGMDGSEKRFKALPKLPYAPYGNEIDWVKATEQGLINPKQSILNENFEPIKFTSKLDLTADWGMIPRAEFPHEAHQQWLDCANCHPDTFNVKKKTTQRFDMQYNVQGKFCGVCHLRVAFPLDDCSRCHPKMSD